MGNADYRAPWHKSVGGIRARDIRRRDREADILRVGLVPGHYADGLSAVVQHRPTAVSRRNGARNLVVTHFIHGPNLADEPVADAEVEAAWGAHHVNPGAD